MLSIREKSQRGFADHQWLKTWHSFSFADYVDTRYNNFSVLRVINEDHIQTGFGFPAHPHKNMEIFTYVLAGTLQHKDSMGNETQLHAGEYQIMSAGTGIYHSEYSVHPTDDAHIYQIWMIPNEKGITPRYEHPLLIQRKVCSYRRMPVETRLGFIKIYGFGVIGLPLKRHKRSHLILNAIIGYRWCEANSTSMVNLSAQVTVLQYATSPLFALLLKLTANFCSSIYRKNNRGHQ